MSAMSSADWSTDDCVIQISKCRPRRVLVFGRVGGCQGEKKGERELCGGVTLRLKNDELEGRKPSPITYYGTGTEAGLRNCKITLRIAGKTEVQGVMNTLLKTPAPCWLMVCFYV